MVSRSVHPRRARTIVLAVDALVTGVAGTAFMFIGFVLAVLVVAGPDSSLYATTIGYLVELVTTPGLHPIELTGYVWLVVLASGVFWHGGARERVLARWRDEREPGDGRPAAGFEFDHDGSRSRTSEPKPSQTTRGSPASRLYPRVERAPDSGWMADVFSSDPGELEVPDGDFLRSPSGSRPPNAGDQTDGDRVESGTRNPPPRSIQVDGGPAENSDRRPEDDRSDQPADERASPTATVRVKSDATSADDDPVDGDDPVSRVRFELERSREAISAVETEFERVPSPSGVEDAEATVARIASSEVDVATELPSGAGSDESGLPDAVDRLRSDLRTVKRGIDSFQRSR